MKKLLMILSVFVAVIAFSGNVRYTDTPSVTNHASGVGVPVTSLPQYDLLCKTFGDSHTNTIITVTVDRDGLCQTRYEPTFNTGVMNGTSATTNLVLVVETVRWVPCACPDGNQGCAVMHARKVRESSYITDKGTIAAWLIEQGQGKREEGEVDAATNP